MIEVLTDVEALESCVGERPASSMLKSIRYLDDHCQALLAASTFAVAGVVLDDGTICAAGLGGDPGHLAVTGPTALALPGLAVDAPDGAPVGLLAFVPGYRETLRVNGRLRRGPAPHLEVEEAFLHCAKALIRSRLWTVTSPALPSAEGAASLDDPAVAALLDACPFVALASCDEAGAADVSPKGDPAGSLVRIVDGTTLAIADRPGNLRTDTMHNLLGRDRLSLLALVPGSDLVLEARGRAAVTADERVRAALEVRGKVPKAAIVLAVEHLEVRREPAITRAGLWDRSRHANPAALPKATQVWVDHVQRSEDTSEMAEMVRGVLTVDAMDEGIAQDYEQNLY